MSDFFQVTYLCDVSQEALKHCAKKVHGDIKPKVTSQVEELCKSPDVDAVLIASATPLHPAQAILALQNNKHVLVEKPLAYCYRDIEALEAAEKQSSGKLFLGYMRRYSPAFLHAIAEINGQQILYARVRDIIGPNSYFVDQTGTFPKAFSDIPKKDIDDLARLNDDIMQQALVTEYGVPRSKTNERMLDLLGGLGSHDLSAMREALGMPRKVLGCSLSMPIWTATFEYDGFPVVYESGFNDVPLFDSHVEIYTEEKIVRVNFDTNFIKGLPTTMTVREKISGPDGEVQYQERHVRTTYEDPYTIQFRHWHDCILKGLAPKTSIADAREDVDVFKMLMQAANLS